MHQEIVKPSAAGRLARWQPRHRPGGGAHVVLRAAGGALEQTHRLLAHARQVRMHRRHKI